MASSRVVSLVRHDAVGAGRQHRPGHDFHAGVGCGAQRHRNHPRRLQPLRHGTSAARKRAPPNAARSRRASRDQRGAAHRRIAVPRAWPAPAARHPRATARRCRSSCAGSTAARPRAPRPSRAASTGRLGGQCASSRAVAAAWGAPGPTTSGRSANAATSSPVDGLPVAADQHELALRCCQMANGRRSTRLTTSVPGRRRSTVACSTQDSVSMPLPRILPTEKPAWESPRCTPRAASQQRLGRVAAALDDDVLHAHVDGRRGRGARAAAATVPPGCGGMQQQHSPPARPRSRRHAPQRRDGRKRRRCRRSSSFSRDGPVP